MTESKSKDKEVRQIHQGKVATDPYSISIWDSVTYSYMDPLFNYLKENPDHQLEAEMFGKQTQNQTIEIRLAAFEENWNAKKKILLSQPKEKRDKDAYFKTVLWTFRFDIMA